MLDIVYCRVSTDEQRENTSLDEQEKRCVNHLTGIDYNNTKVFREDFSGFELDRPELDKIKNLIQAGKVRSFTALRVDRLCRKVSVLEFLREGYFKPFGVEVYSLDLGKWLWNPQHESMQEQYALMASNWGKMAVLAMQEGRKAHIEKGNVITAGTPPLGLNEVVEFNSRGKRIGAHFEFNETESLIVIRIFENYVNDGMSIAGIAKQLKADKVPTYSQIRGWTPFSGKEVKKSEWQSSTVRQILRNPVYDGRWYFGKRKTFVKFENGKQIKYRKRVKSTEGLIEVKVPALIPHDIFLEAQRTLDKNKKEKAGRKVSYEYLLARRMTCNCGYKMRVQTKEKGKKRYYACPQYTKAVANKDCKVKHNRADSIDELAWNWLHNLLSNRKELKSRISNYISEQEKITKPLKDNLIIIEDLVTKKEAEHDSMLSSYFKLPELAQAKAIATMEQLEAAINEYRTERNEIKEEIERHEATTREIRLFVNDYTDKEYVRFAAYFETGRSDITDEESNEHFINSSSELSDSGVDFRKIAKMIEDVEQLTFDDKLKYAQQFDLQGKIIIEDNQKKLFVSCVLGSEVLLLLDGTQLSTTQFQTRFYITFSDILTIDFNQLPQFNKMEAI